MRLHTPFDFNLGSLIVQGIVLVVNVYIDSHCYGGRVRI